MSEKKFLLVKGLAGLGNRMLSALTAILYARLSGRRLIIDWSDPTFSKNGSNAFLEFFICPTNGPTDEIPVTDSVNPSVWRHRLSASATSMRTPYKNLTEFWQNTSIDLKKLDYDEDILILWLYHEKVTLLRDHFKGAYEEYIRMSNEAILTRLLREDLLPHPRIQTKVNEFKHKEFTGKTVGVHIRYTDHRASLLAILDKLNTLLRLEPGLQVFLATDNIQIKKMFEENYPGVITTPHWYPKPGSRIHNNLACPDRLESGIESLVDLYLLAECDYLIIDTSSTFSYVAKLLTNAQKSHVFDVAKGGKLTPGVRQLSWRLMLRLGLYSWGLSSLSKFLRVLKYTKPKKDFNTD
jgi:hypothetical protein